MRFFKSHGLGKPGQRDAFPYSLFLSVYSLSLVKNQPGERETPMQQSEVLWGLNYQPRLVSEVLA